MSAPCSQQMAATCSACALHDQGYPVMSVPRIGATLMAVVAAPSYHDVVVQKPLSAQSAAGAYLRRAMDVAGLTKSEVHFASVLRHRPPEGRAPTLSEMGACMSILRAEIDEVRPRAILALGEDAARALGVPKPLRDTTPHELFPYTADFGDLPIICASHPGARGGGPRLSVEFCVALSHATSIARSPS